MNIVGLGDAGCNIAEAFSQYPQYKIFKINVDIEGEGCYNILKCSTAEEYESLDLSGVKTFLREATGETMFIIGGSGKISCASLRILEYIKNLPISILYIKPDLGMLNEVQKMQERLVFGVVQEYARSGVFDEVCIVSNTALESAVGGAPIIGYYDKLNQVLVSALHMINVFKNTESVIGQIEKPKETHRITTIGLFDIEKNEEKMFFSLDKARQRCYIYSINENKLKTDGDLFSKLKNQVKGKSKEGLKRRHTLFYSTDYDYDLGYIIERNTKTFKRQELN